MSPSSTPTSAEPRHEPGRARCAVTTARLPLGDVEMLRHLDRREVAQLERLVPGVPWPMGTSLPDRLRLRDHVFVVRQGRIALLGTAPGGHRMMVALLERGGVFSSLGDAPVPEAMALEDAVVSPLSGRTLRALVARRPRIGIDLAEALTDRLALLREVVAGVGQMHVEDRLWARILALASRAGIATADGVELRLRLTHRQWAMLAGGSRESVTLAFGRLRRAAMLEVRGSTIVIPWAHMDRS